MKFLVTLLGVAAVFFGAPGVRAAAEFVGSERCVGCHEAETRAWRGSHHDLAMAEAGADTVLGDFNDAQLSAHGVTSRFHRKDGRYYVSTDGPDGAMHDYVVRYTFGWYPLQQYLVKFPGGRYQALPLAWDSRAASVGGQRWFHLYPDESMDRRNPLHWTRMDQTWNYQCAECHSTNLQKNYDLKTDTYRTTWSEIDVACEACHGPGSTHLDWAAKAAVDESLRKNTRKGLVVDLGDRSGGTWVFDESEGKPRRTRARPSRAQSETCARCHSRRGQLWASYEYGKPLGDTHRLALLDDHLYFPDGQIKDEVYVYGSFIQSRMYRAGVTCSDCHEPHSLQLRAPGNAVCTRCHKVARYDTVQHTHHGAGSGADQCTACHMPRRTYMVVDQRADHSMRVPRPDLSAKLGTPNACNGCHADKTVDWAAQAVAGWFPASSHRGPHFGETLHAAATGVPDAGEQLAALAGDAAQPGIARATALARLRQYAEQRHLATVERLLGEGDPLIRAAAVRFLEVTDLRTRVDLGWALIDDPVRAVRLEVARILAPLLRQRLPKQLRAQLAEAIEEYRQSQLGNAERPESHLNLGLIAIDAGDLQAAENAYRTALRLDPKFGPGYVNLADLYRRQGHDAEGEAVLRTGAAAVGADADLAHALGLLLVRQKHLQQALPYLKRAAELAADRPRYAYVYALALQGAGHMRLALQTLEHALKHQPRDRDILQALADSYAEQGDQEKAAFFAGELARYHPQASGQEGR